MAYIGNKPTVGNFQICDAISVVNGQAAYTMQVGSVNVIPQSANHMIVSLNGTIQKPNSSFTVSGSTITFSSNLVTNDVIDFIQILGDVLDLGVPSDSTVSLAKLTATGTKDATTFLRGDNTFATVVSGLTEADNWRITTDIANPSGFITTNWERSDSTGSGYLGTGMTESSGVFSFPSTGYYLVIAFGLVKFTAGAHDGGDFSINATTDNSNYTRTMLSQSSSATTNYNQATSGCMIFDVTDTSTHKIKFSSSGTWSLKGSTSENRTHVLFIKLGDT